MVAGATKTAEDPIEDFKNDEKSKSQIIFQSYIGQSVAAAASDVPDGRFHDTSTPPTLEERFRRVEAAIDAKYQGLAQEVQQLRATATAVGTVGAQLRDEAFEHTKSQHDTQQRWRNC